MQQKKVCMEIIRSEIFNNFSEIIFGMSTKIGLDRQAPFFFNMSLNVGDNPQTVKENREAFFKELGLSNSEIAFQKQIHSDIIRVIDKPGYCGESDAMITAKNNIGLAVSTADCTSIFIYDNKNKVIAGVHSGWRSTQKQILKKTLNLLSEDFNSKPDNLFAYVGPSISQKKYEIGKEVAEMFDEKYIYKKNGKLFLDVAAANIDMLCNFGVPKSQIEISVLCTYEEKRLLHSFRRDGKHSGRMLGVIALKG